MGAGESTCCPDSLDVGANCAERSQGCPSVLSVLLGGNVCKVAALAGPAVQDGPRHNERGNNNREDGYDLYCVHGTKRAERRGHLREYLRCAKK